MRRFLLCALAFPTSPGTRVPIPAAEAVKDTRLDYIVILAWNIADEMTQQLDHVCELGGRCVVSISTMKVLLP